MSAHRRSRAARRAPGTNVSAHARAPARAHTPTPAPAPPAKTTAHVAGLHSGFVGDGIPVEPRQSGGCQGRGQGQHQGGTGRHAAAGVGAGAGRRRGSGRQRACGLALQDIWRGKAPNRGPDRPLVGADGTRAAARTLRRTRRSPPRRRPPPSRRAPHPLASSAPLTSGGQRRPMWGGAGRLGAELCRG